MVFFATENGNLTVYHKMLLSNLDFYSKTDEHYKLYKSYLTNRYKTSTAV